MNDRTEFACDFLRVALSLLDDDEALMAAAMISGALDILERRPDPVNYQYKGPGKPLAFARPGGWRHVRSCA
ncbi:hypothetical protein [Novosphingobium soli]|uniref:Uncharacterized protein n=1 Tax=Novosphingobium soli TaxID=574956 RepID=A0ABV6CVE0_9SPHN